MAKLNYFKRKELSQSTHDSAVFALASILEANGFTVLADHQDWYAKPVQLKDMKNVPDIFAMKKHPNSPHVERYFFEIETIDSYQSRHALDQLTEFNAWGENGISTYWVIVCRTIPWLYFKREKAAALIERYSLGFVQLAHFDPTNNRFEVFAR
jgi:hypothetical protein